MQIEVNINGDRYISVSEESDEATVEQFKDALYAGFDNLNKFQMKLDGGGYLLLPSEAAKNAVIVIRE